MFVEDVKDVKGSGGEKDEAWSGGGRTKGGSSLIALEGAPAAWKLQEVVDGAKDLSSKGLQRHRSELLD